jgi:hypothetical protein
MLLAATAYNLQKLLRSRIKRRQSAIMALPRPLATTPFFAFLSAATKINFKEEYNQLWLLPLTLSCATATHVGHCAFLY